MIFRNVLKYRDKSLVPIYLNRRMYLFDSGFSPDVLVGMSFGSRNGENSHNGRLIQSILDFRKYDGKDLPVIAQSEIADGLRQKGLERVFSVGENYQKGDRAASGISKVDTPMVLEQVRGVIERESLGKNILYFGHPAHMQRILDTAREKGIEGKPFVAEKPEWFSDKQWWVSYRALWALREVPGRGFSKHPKLISAVRWVGNKLN